MTDLRGLVVRLEAIVRGSSQHSNSCHLGLGSDMFISATSERYRRKSFKIERYRWCMYILLKLQIYMTNEQLLSQCLRLVVQELYVMGHAFDSWSWVDDDRPQGQTWHPHIVTLDLIRKYLNKSRSFGHCISN